MNQTTLIFTTKIIKSFARCIFRTSGSVGDSGFGFRLRSQVHYDTLERNAKWKIDLQLANMKHDYPWPIPKFNPPPPTGGMWVCACVPQTHPDVLVSWLWLCVWSSRSFVGSVVSMVNKLLSRYFITSLVVSDSWAKGGGGGIGTKGCHCLPPTTPPPIHRMSVRECVQFFNLCDFWLPPPPAYA